MKAIILTLLVSFAMLGSLAQSWQLKGNNGTNPDSNFLGTINNRDLVLRTNNVERLRITKNGKLGLGTTTPQQKLDVNGNINIAEGSAIYVGNERVLYFPKAGPFPGVFIGQLSGNNDGGFLNTAVGYAALHAVKGEGNANVAMGSYALTTNTQGNGNSAVGYSALYKNTTGYDNAAVGADALYYNTTGSLNTALGMFTLNDNTTGFYNTATGFYALNNNTTGNNNTATGYYALSSDSTGSYNTAMGNYADINEKDITNSTVIGNNALGTASNQVRIGNSDVTSIGGYTDWTKISDARVKKNIKENVPGLSFINKLKPVTYNLNLDAADDIIQRPAIKDKTGRMIQPVQEDLSARKIKEQVVYTGFIAQDVEKAAKELSYDFSGVDAAKNNKDLYGLRYAEFVVPLVKAVQELSSKNQELEDRNNQLEKRIERLEALSGMQSSNSMSQLSENPNIDLPTCKVKIFPNPFQSILNIQFSPANKIQKRINIYDATGKLVATKSTEGDTQLNLKPLASGNYLVKITDGYGKLLFDGKVTK